MNLLFKLPGLWYLVLTTKQTNRGGVTHPCSRWCWLVSRSLGAGFTQGSPRLRLMIDAGCWRSAVAVAVTVSRGFPASPAFSQPAVSVLRVQPARWRLHLSWPSSDVTHRHVCCILSLEVSHEPQLTFHRRRSRLPTFWGDESQNICRRILDHIRQTLSEHPCSEKQYPCLNRGLSRPSPPSLGSEFVLLHSHENSLQKWHSRSVCVGVSLYVVNRIHWIGHCQTFKAHTNCRKHKNLSTVHSLNRSYPTLSCCKCAFLWTVVLEKTLESPLDCKEIQPVNPKGNQSWIFIGRTDVEAETPILWPSDVKNWLIWKDPDAGKDWRQEEKGMTKDEMVGWHHQLDGHEFEQALGVGDRQGSLACCSPWGHRDTDTTEWLNWTWTKGSWEM